MPLEKVDSDFLKNNYFPGFTFFGTDKQPLSKDFYEGHLRRALSTLEDTINIDILEREVKEELHDYRADDYAAFAFLQLFRVPTQKVTSLTAVYPTGQTILVYPNEWIRLEKNRSQLQLVPTAGTISQVLLGQGGTYLPLIYGRLSYLPHLWKVDYVSGFPKGEIPLLVVDTIAKLAVLNIFMIVADLIHPLGVASQSLSVDGLAQSRGYISPAFRARIDGYRTDLYGPSGMGGGQIDQIRSTYLPSPWTAL